MGRPAFPTRRQVQQLRDAALLPDATTEDLAPGNSTIVTLQLQPHGLALVRIVP